MSAPRKTKLARTKQDLAGALQSLRLLIKEVGGNYLAGLQSDVARAELAVRAARSDPAPSRRQAAELRAMLKWINGLDVKPEKGRRRDLKEIDRVVSRLADVVDNW